MNESATWHDTYADEVQRERRLRMMPEKLAKLGVTSAVDRNIRILDLCCGHGEALESFYSLGFRDLHGVDLEVTPTLVADTRFTARQGDVLKLAYPDASIDWTFCIHSMHHFASADNVRKFVDEAYRVLKPGGRLSIIDFPASLQIKAAFWFFRQNIFLVTPYLKWFGRITQEEWWFLKDYLPQWPQVHAILHRGRFTVESEQRELFYFYLTLRKPLA